ncbi:Na(+)/H(+) antiporter subunit B [Halobacterium salinarum]|uniref:Na(+)/H(+) antiporter subunit B n=1 Tax=Halobacterium salinarum TaxID=2242 RepID=UPI001F21694B|nr:Na(+)/H(+) antiporter subunit B [Halobacterium salinarum]MCF2207841.1 Na(+)/H(+) antiporter subunit B [Halobacterium salinarum]MCF2240446.1 Na(+)/H(+) antiporter subunit B [Halobacterium salinarum]
MSDRPPSSQRQSYIESSIIMGTVRVVSPFVFTYGLFVMFHGADSAGGGFQGGVIVATVMLMLGIAFGIDPVREWVGERLLVAIVVGGVTAFLAVASSTVLLGGAFLDVSVFGGHHASKYSIEIIELFIGAIVASTITGLFIAIDAGTSDDGGNDK